MKDSLLYCENEKSSRNVNIILLFLALYKTIAQHMYNSDFDGEIRICQKFLDTGLAAARCAGVSAFVAFPKGNVGAAHQAAAVCS